MLIPTPAVIEPANINLSQRAVIWAAPLNGTWKFRLGDDASWATPQLDDSNWGQIDLTPAPGAHDPDVGLSGYVAGWAANGYKGYSGYAWYRARVAGLPLSNQRLALVGPVLVDSAYQVFLNGKLLGGVGNFTRKPPTAYGIRPTIFVVTRSLTQRRQDLLVAVRVWMGPWLLPDPQAGGIHIAPVLGNVAGARAAYKVQWLERMRGELPELTAIAFFTALAVMAYTLSFIDAKRSALHWMSVSLLLLAAIRANLVVFWCSGAESVQTFEFVSVVLLVPVTLGAWIITWHKWLLGVTPSRIPYVVGVLTALYVGCAFLTRSWFYGVVPTWLAHAARVTTFWDRRALLAVLLLTVYSAFRTRPREAWSALPAIVLIGIGQFASELAALGVPGIWFPADMGVSSANFAYAFASIAIFALLTTRIRWLRSTPRRLYPGPAPAQL